MNAPTALPSARRSLGLFLAIAVLVTGWRILVLAGSPLGLSFDEAQYWLWSRSFQFGYYSKPPMVAWVIGLAGSFCGDGPACVRLPSSLAYFGASLALFLLGRRMYGDRAGFWIGLAFLTLPAVAYSSMVITTDPFLLLFWAWALYFLWRALAEDRLVWWAAVGLCLGLGMLAKYAMALFLASLALYLALTPARRPLLKSKGPWLAAAIGLLLYAPNFLWNLSNQFVSYKHTKDNANLGGPLFHPDKGLEFIGAQFAVFGPLLFAILLYLLTRARPLARGDERARLLLAMMAPLAAMMVTVAFLSRANANWSAPIYVAGSVLTIGWLVEKGWIWAIRASVILHLALAALLYDFDRAARTFGVELTAKTDFLKRLRGWDEIGMRISQRLATRPGHLLLLDERKLMASLTYYVTPHPFDAVKWNPKGRITDTFDQTTNMKDKIGRDFVYISERRESDKVTAHFDSAQRLEDIVVTIRPGYERRFKVYDLRGFKGYGPAEEGEMGEDERD